MATELSLEFELIPYEFDDPVLKSPDFLALNPMGAIPTLLDGEFALSESLAINLYLAERYGSHVAEPLYPRSQQARAEVVRWALFAQGHLEPWVQKDALLADLVEAIGDRGGAMIAQSLAVLERVLEKSEWLVGEAFSAADLNVAGVLSPSRAAFLDLAAFPRVAHWLDRCYARPAAVATRRRFGGSAR